MKNNTRYLKSIISAFVLLFSSQAFSLPIAIDNCIASGTCAYGGLSYVGSADGNLIFGHNLFDFRSGTAEQKVLMEYQLGSGSHTDTAGFDYDTYQALPLQTTNISGSLWLEANMSYDLSSSLHAITLYFDQATPSEAPAGIWGDTTWTGSPVYEQHLNITTAGLLAGSGEAYAQCCDYPYPPGPQPFNSTAESNPSLFDSNGDGLLLCVAEGCFDGAIVNLLGLQYVNTTGARAELIFNINDTRSLIYYTTAGYDGYSTTTYSVSAVPVPPAIWLFSFGLLSLMGAAKRKTNAY